MGKLLRVVTIRCAVCVRLSPSATTTFSSPLDGANVGVLTLSCKKTWCFVPIRAGIGAGNGDAAVAGFTFRLRFIIAARVAARRAGSKDAAKEVTVSGRARGVSMSSR